MDKLNSRYNINFITWLLIGITASFLLSLAVMQFLTALLVILWLTERFSEKKLAFERLELIFLIFILFRLVSVTLSEFPESSYQSLYKDLLFYCSLFAFSFYFKAIPIENAKKIMRWSIYSAALVSVIGIVLFNLGIKDRAASITSGYATFSTYLVVMFAIVFTVYNKNSAGITRIFWTLISGILFTGIVVALSRTDIGIAIIVLAAGAVITKLKIADVSLIIGIVLVLSFTSFLNNTKQVTGRIEKPASLSDRDIIWGTALEKAGEHPFFGFGVRTFKDVFNRSNELNDKGVGGWHNDYIAVYIESGMFGLTAFLLLIYEIFFEAYKMYKSKKGSDEIKYIFIILLSISGILLSALMSGFITNPILSILFTFILGIYSSFYSKIFLKNTH